MWFGNSQEYFGMSFVDLLLSEPLNWGKYKLSHAILSLSKALLRPATKNTSQKCHFWWRLLKLKHGCFTPSHPFTCGTRCNMMLVNFPATARSPSTWRRWNNMAFLLFQPLSWYSTHNFQTSIHYIHYAHISFCHCHQKMGLPLCCLFHLFWMVLKHFNMCLGSCCFCCRICGFLQNTSHRSWCFQRIALTANHRHPPTTAATMIKIIW